KRPKEANRVDDFDYCKYHQSISHPLEKIIESGIIKHDINALVSQYNIMDKFIKFGSFNPITLALSRSKMVNFKGIWGNHLFLEYQNGHDWTLATCQRSQ
ncbi:hypothetical protein Gotur_017030, partial [Gossypium turneri]